MMKRHPTRSTCRVQQGIKDGPVCDCVRSVFHSLSFAKGRRNGTGVEMIAADRHRCFQITSFDEIVYRFAHLGAFAVAEPANARRQSLKVDAIARKLQPSVERAIFWNQL